MLHKSIYSPWCVNFDQYLNINPLTKSIRLQMLHIHQRVQENYHGLSPLMRQNVKWRHHTLERAGRHTSFAIFRLHGDQSQGELTVLELFMFHSEWPPCSLMMPQSASKPLTNEASKPSTLHRSSYLPQVTIMTSTAFKLGNEIQRLVKYRLQTR